MKVSDSFISFVRCKFRLRYGYQIWTTVITAGEESRTHSFTGPVDATIMLLKYFWTETHIPTSIFWEMGRVLVYFL